MAQLLVTCALVLAFLMAGVGVSCVPTVAPAYADCGGGE